MTINKTNIEFSIFSIALQQFLEESHPHLSANTEFIKSRGDGAANIFEIFRANGSTIDESIEQANEFLYQGLLFSVHDMIKEILEDEFADRIDPEDILECAFQLEEVVAPLLEKYQIDDDFESSEEYDQLYTEAVGAILIHLNEYGI